MTDMSSLFQLRDIKTKRVSSYDRTGGNSDCLPIAPGETAVLADIKGAGIIQHIWFTISCSDPMIRRNAILRMYWDGETVPSVEAPLGDFFGQGWGEKYLYSSLPFAASPVGGNGLNCYVPMPFGDGARVTIENQSDQPIGSFYYYIDYHQYPSMPDSAGRFHAWWNREITSPEGQGQEGSENEWNVLHPQAPLNPTDVNNYLFADIVGKGQFIGVHYFVDCPTPVWYGEGDDMWLIDGEPWPGSLHGTGTEDFFNSCWCPKEAYSHPYFGYPRVNNDIGWLGRTHCYRFFIQDAIYFDKSLRASIEHGHANVLTLDLSSVAFWYQAEPHKVFPKIPPKTARQNMPTIGITEIHRWRDAWRKAMSMKNPDGTPLWGNEKGKE